MNDPTNSYEFDAADAPLGLVEPGRVTVAVPRSARRARGQRASAGAAARLPRLIAGRYELLDPLGHGGSGQVWRANDRRLRREVAVKLGNSSPESARGVARRFAVEQAALARIQWPGVARILDSGHDLGEPFLVMDIVRGRTLADILDEVRSVRREGSCPSPADFRRAVREACPPGAVDLLAGDDWFQVVARVLGATLRTLEAVHAVGVLHRDIKPANLVIRGCGCPALVDFGMAFVPGGHRRSSSHKLDGTLPCLAPEQLTSHCTGTDPRTDLYQVGLLLYELLALRPAFDPRSTTCVDDVRGGRFVRPSWFVRAVPKELEDICLRAIATRVERRYQSAAEFREDLERWLGGEQPPLASLHGCCVVATFKRIRYAARRRRVLLTTVAGVVLGTILAGEMRVGRSARLDPPVEYTQPAPRRDVDVPVSDDVATGEVRSDSR